MFTFMQTGDPHVDTVHHGRLNPDTGLDFVLESNVRTLEFLVDKAIEENVDMFFLTGDLVSAGAPKPEIYVQLSRVLNKLVDAKIPLQMVEGNHERLWIPAKHHTSMNVISHLLHNVTVEDNCTQMQLVKHENCNVLVIPYPMKARILSALGKHRVDPTEGDALVVQHVIEKASEMAELRDPDLPFIVTGHFTVDGIGLPGSEKDISNMMNECVFPVNGFESLDPDFVALGHIHTPQQVGEKTFYAGSPNKLTFTDANDVKGGNLVRLNSDKSIDIERVNTPVRGMYKVDLAKEDFSLDLVRNDVVQVLLPQGEKEIPEELMKFAAEREASLVKKTRKPEQPNRKRTILPEKISPLTALETYLEDQSVESKTLKDLLSLAKDLGVNSK